MREKEKLIQNDSVVASLIGQEQRTPKALGMWLSEEKMGDLENIVESRSSSKGEDCCCKNYCAYSAAVWLKKRPIQTDISLVSRYRKPHFWNKSILH